jgi:hypothetical protein
VTPTARRQWPAFVAHVHSRLEAGARAYGDKSFAASPEALVLEVQQELEDVCGWAFVLWVRLEAIREALEAARSHGDSDANAHATTSATKNPTSARGRQAGQPSALTSLGERRTAGRSSGQDSEATFAGLRYGPTPEGYPENGDGA